MRVDYRQSRAAVRPRGSHVPSGSSIRTPPPRELAEVGWTLRSRSGHRTPRAVETTVVGGQQSGRDQLFGAARIGCREPVEGRDHLGCRHGRRRSAARLPRGRRSGGRCRLADDGAGGPAGGDARRSAGGRPVGVVGQSAAPASCAATVSGLSAPTPVSTVVVRLTVGGAACTAGAARTSTPRTRSRTAPASPAPARPASRSLASQLRGDPSRSVGSPRRSSMKRTVACSSADGIRTGPLLAPDQIHDRD